MRRHAGGSIPKYLGIRVPLRERGSALILALLVALIVALLALGLLLQASLGLESTATDRRITQSLLAADAGVMLATHLFKLGQTAAPDSFVFTHEPGPGRSLRSRYQVTISSVCEAADPGPVIPRRESRLVYEYPRFFSRQLHICSEAAPVLAGERSMARALVEAEVRIWPFDTLPDQVEMCSGADLFRLPGQPGSEANVARVRAQESTAGRGEETWLVFSSCSDGGSGTGDAICAVDAESGASLLQRAVDSAPGPAAALDADMDGWTDSVYFGDAGGSIWQLDMEGMASAWRLTRIFRTASRGRQGGGFFTAPKLVPIGQRHGQIRWALAIGSGDPERLEVTDGVANRFFFLALDTEKNTSRDEHDLVVIDHDARNDSEICAFNRRDKLGWALRLRQNEKVAGQAIVAGVITFSTFQVTDSSRVDGNSANPGADASPGVARVYTVYACCAEPFNAKRWEERQSMTYIGAVQVDGYTVTVSDTETEQSLPVAGNHVVMSWRQDEGP
jgi:Tfp pilus assembly protein PilX